MLLLSDGQEQPFISLSLKKRLFRFDKNVKLINFRFEDSINSKISFCCWWTQNISLLAILDIIAFYANNKQLWSCLVCWTWKTGEREEIQEKRILEDQLVSASIIWRIQLIERSVWTLHQKQLLFLVSLRGLIKNFSLRNQYSNPLVTDAYGDVFLTNIKFSSSLYRKSSQWKNEKKNREKNEKESGASFYQLGDRNERMNECLSLCSMRCGCRCYFLKIPPSRWFTVW